MLRLAVAGTWVVWVVLGAPTAALAQREFLGDRCGPMLALCSLTGSPCPETFRPVTVSAPDGRSICLCAPGDMDLGLPALCCNAAVGGTCPVGSTCANIDGTISDVCVDGTIDLCAPATGALSRDAVIDCFTPPGAPASTPYWGLGDCDQDGRPNATEIDTDPCCNEDTDFDCCMMAFDDAARCCAATSSDPEACCLSAGLEPGICCAADPLGCCEATSNPQDCCLAAGGEALDCCHFSTTPGACCFASGGDRDTCCPLAGDETLSQCLDAGVADAGSNTLDASGPQDASALDGSIATDASGAFDGGMGADAAPGLDAGSLGFGGGGGCRCSAQGSSRPTPWMLLLGALAIAIPTFRRRR